MTDQMAFICPRIPTRNDESQPVMRAVLRAAAAGVWFWLLVFVGVYSLLAQ